ncbi:unnamed protein product [Amoebophrya sp. A120]|nr:unnamed protein product [Amoebophrya sp. A120]|eukprot:GSA120T00022397001.1
MAVPLLANDDESSAPEQHDLSSSMPSNETETSNGDTTTAQQLQGTNIEDVEDGDGDQSESQAPQAPPPEENTRSSSTPSGGGGGGTIAPEHDEQYRRVPRATMQVHLEEGAS